MTTEEAKLALEDAAVRAAAYAGGVIARWHAGTGDEEEDRERSALCAQALRFHNRARAVVRSASSLSPLEIAAALDEIESGHGELQAKCRRQESAPPPRKRRS